MGAGCGALAGRAAWNRVSIPGCHGNHPAERTLAQQSLVGSTTRPPCSTIPAGSLESKCPSRGVSSLQLGLSSSLLSAITLVTCVLNLIGTVETSLFKQHTVPLSKRNREPVHEAVLPATFWGSGRCRGVPTAGGAADTRHPRPALEGKLSSCSCSGHGAEANHEIPYTFRKGGAGRPPAPGQGIKHPAPGPRGGVKGLTLSPLSPTAPWCLMARSMPRAASLAARGLPWATWKPTSPRPTRGPSCPTCPALYSDTAASSSRNTFKAADVRRKPEPGLVKSGEANATHNDPCSATPVRG